ncbi:MAG TPA: helix-turn-helix transcriptional regulator, partial [Planctomycetota bacterium]|nr:helix-turn-helix transcriptional regulator [Planctomycetota bacterium]
CVSFDIAGAPRLRALGARPLLLVRRARDPVAMRMRLRDVCQRLERTRGLAGAWRTSAVLALLATAHDDAGATAADADPRVDAALVAIEARLADAALSLGDLAGAAALSPDRLTTLFRQRFGRTPMRQVACMRLARARNLLTRSDLSVKQVAAAVGFRDPLYFSRAFRAAFGQPPTAAR